MIPYFYRVTRYTNPVDALRVRPVSKIPEISFQLNTVPELELPSALPLHSPKDPSAYHAPEDTIETHLLPDANFFPTDHLWHVNDKPYPEKNLAPFTINIMAVVTKEHSPKILMDALDLARRYQGKLFIVSLGDQSAPELYALLDELSKKNPPAKDSPALSQSPTVFNLEKQAPVSELLELALNHHIHLTIWPSLLQTTEKSLLMAEEFILQAGSPVLILNRSPFMDTKDILVAVDNSPGSYLAISQGISLCQQFGSNLHLLHVSQNKTEGEKEHTQLIQKLSLMNWQNTLHDLITPTGNMSETLLAYLNHHQIGCLIMGIHRSHIQNMGESITLTLLDKARCPVMIVHPYKD